MGYRHLTDFEIQDALDGTLRRQRPLLQLHLDKCELCGHRLSDYRAVVSSMSAVTSDPISADATDAIMNRIESSGIRGYSKLSLVSTLGWLGVGLSTVATIGWVIARTDFITGVKELALTYVQSASMQADKLMPLVGNNVLALTGVAALGIMMAVDAVIRRWASGEKLLSL